MKSHLSHILPVSKACEILGRPLVHRIVASLLQLQRRQAPGLMEIESIVNKMLVDQPQKSSLIPSDVPPPPPPGPLHKQERELALDKPTLHQFVVPSVVQPHPGVGGHMGFFDCWIYMLQGHAMSQRGAISGLIWVTDVLIMLAVCKDYRNYQLAALEKQTRDDVARENGEDETKDDNGDAENGKDSKEDDEEDAPVWTMALLAFRMYDSYQKKGSVSRDTLHRFMTDIHGDDSFKRPKAQALLDQIFNDTNHSVGWLQASVSEATFCRRILATLTPGRPHFLLDWLSLLGSAMIPPDEIPQSVSAYLDTIEHRPKSLCETYSLADHRLFEVKRRFHSIVQSSSQVIEGDPMKSSLSEDDQAQPPKRVIRLDGFCGAVCEPVEDLGHGGYLPQSLARLLFTAGCRRNDSNVGCSNKPLAWGLYDVINFGCIAVRQSSHQDPDTALLRFIFNMFACDDNAIEESLVVGVASDLKPEQLARMFKLLVELDNFRVKHDSQQQEDLDEGTVDVVETSGLPRKCCLDLGLLPESLASSNEDSIDPLHLANETLKEVTENGMKVMDFDTFKAWNMSKPHNYVDDAFVCRLEPLIMDLRLIASVLFGIPPTLASMEIDLVYVLEERHKTRYPRTEVSRRGPRGTIWAFITNDWYKDWRSLTGQAANTDEDGSDGRGSSQTDLARGLRRINNAVLMADHGSLALRQKMAWRQDYELIPPLVWSALQAWYDGGPPVHRSVVKFVDPNAVSSPHIKQSRAATDYEIELFPHFVSIYMADAASKGEARPFQQNYQMSRVTPVGILLVQLCRELDTDPSLARLWVLGSEPEIDNDSGSADDWILSSEKSFTEQRRKRRSGGISLLLELKDEDSGLWPRGVDGKTWTFSKEKVDEGQDSDLGDGIVGLYNVG